MLPPKSFYMIRHGQTEHNISQIAAGGETDSALTELGRKQAQELAPYLINLEMIPSRIFHSSMQRARHTAEYLNEFLGLEMEEIHDLREQEIGDWAGRPWSDPEIRFTRDTAPPNGETSAQFGARVQRAITYCLEKTENVGPPLIVCHGGLFFGLGIMYNIYEAITEIENCQLHYFEPHDDYPFFPWKIVQYVTNGGWLESEATPFCATRLKRAAS
jgi:probable phosphoglycerate mutase